MWVQIKDAVTIKKGKNFLWKHFAPIPTIIPIRRGK